MTSVHKHPYDRRGHFLCWTTPRGFTVQVADCPGKQIEVTSAEAQQALRWGTEAGLSAGERAAAARLRVTGRERGAYALPSQRPARQLIAPHQPLTGFQVTVGSARFWIAAPDVRRAVAVLMNDREALADSPHEFEGGLSARALSFDEQSRILLVEDDYSTPATLADVVAQLNDLRAPAMLCAASRTNDDAG